MEKGATNPFDLGLYQCDTFSSGVRSGADIDDHGTPFFSVIHLSY